MKKAILTLSIISIAIAAVAFLLFISVLTVFWEPMCLLFSTAQDIVAAEPIIPIGSMVYIIGCLLVAVTACIFTNSSRVIVFEIIAIILLTIAIPVLVWCLSMVQTIYIAHNIGEIRQVTLSIATQMGSFASGLTAVSEACCLVVCGMSISEKIHLKKANPCASQTMK